MLGQGQDCHEVCAADWCFFETVLVTVAAVLLTVFVPVAVAAEPPTVEV